MITCKNSASATKSCAAMFPTGSWQTQTVARRSTFRLTRAGHTVALGKAVVTGRKLSVSVPKRVGKGAYVLTVRDSAGRLITKTRVTVK